MEFSKFNIDLKTKFHIGDSIYVVDVHDKKLRDCVLQNIDLHTYNGMRQQPVLQVTYVCYVNGEVNTRNFTVGGMVGESYFFYSDREEAKQHLIKII